MSEMIGTVLEDLKQIQEQALQSRSPPRANYNNIFVFRQMSDQLQVWSDTRKS